MTLKFLHWLSTGSLLATTVIVAACSESAPSDGSSGTATTSGSGGATGSTSTGTGSGSGGAAAVSCDEYCDELMANCSGQNQQYGANANCLATCAQFELGARADKTGNSVACRLYHAGAPAKNDPATHCVNAGPSGGDASHCGPDCAGYCAIVMGVCTGANQPYADQAACMAACGQFESTATTPYKVGAAGDNLACRLYHATAAAVDPDGHCSHTAEVSPVCK